MTDTTTSRPGPPWAEAADTYTAAGWHVMPLAAGTKYPPPRGFTGAEGRTPSSADLYDWIDTTPGDANIALRMTADVVGLDVDQYGDKRGADNLDTFREANGLDQLPATWTSTSRTLPSGIRFYRVPEGTRLRGNPVDAVEAIQHHHRYAVAWPSIHPTGDPYLWHGPDGVEVDEPPAVDDLPELPGPWLDALADSRAGDQPADLPAAAEHREATWTAKVTHVFDQAVAGLGTAGSRHDAALTGSAALARLEQLGHAGATAALDQLGARFIAAIGDERDGVTEWRDLLDGARDKVRTTASTASYDVSWLGDVQYTPAGTGPAVEAVEAKPPQRRRLRITPAAAITPERVRWLWDGRLALGTLGLLAGPEGLGKSTIAYWLASRITCGELPGELAGTPRGVLVCATEDSWAHTIVPRLMAHGADLNRVYRIEATLPDDDSITVGLSLPRDLDETEAAARQVEAGLLILDPLMSRLGDLDTHRDSDVRRALEPLVSVADRVAIAILGLIHHNKSGSADPLQLVMASKAFTAVARSVHTAIWDPDNEPGGLRRLFGTPKNNLGRTDLPTLSFTIHGWTYAVPGDTVPGSTGRIEWGAEVEGSIGDAMARAEGDPVLRSATTEAAEWLADYLQAYGPKVSSADVKRDGANAGHGARALQRARTKVGLDVVAEGFPRVTYWVEHVAQSDHQS